MPTPRLPIPTSLTNCWFTTEQAHACGVNRRQLWSANYRAVMPGVWEVRTASMFLPGTGTAEGLQTRLPAVLAARPQAVASHITAAILLGFRLPFQPSVDQRIHLSLDLGVNPLRVKGFVGHQFQPGRGDVWRAGGVRVTSPARTLLDLAAMRTARGRPLFTEEALVAMADGIVNEHFTGFSRGQVALRNLTTLMEDLRTFSGLRGVARTRTAVEQALPGVDSPLETNTRLLLHQHGLTGWETDVELGAPGHRFVWPDLADRHHKIALQVEGAHHDQRGQRVRDIQRQRATEAAGWTEIRVVSTDLVVGPHDPPGSVPRLITLVRDARAQASARAGTSNPHATRSSTADGAVA